MLHPDEPLVHSCLPLEHASCLEENIRQQVKTLYEQFPYPGYGSLARPRLQEAYLLPAAFTAALGSPLMQTPLGVWQTDLTSPQTPAPLLIAGCGDSQPYLFAQLEPAHHHLTFIDISEKNLRRAKSRLGLKSKACTWHAEDLQSYLASLGQKQFAHIDLYGVLHHLANPTQVLALLSAHLAPLGSLRLMVYNQQARAWIKEIQAIFRLLRLSPFVRTDRQIAKSLLRALARQESLKRYFQGLGRGIYTNDSRLVDTFFHCREVRWSLSRWLELFTAVGLKPFALFDRYGELDDLPNPLWQMPTAPQLESRSQDRRFENNLEVFLYKPTEATMPLRLLPPRRWFAGLCSQTFPLWPPASWFSFKETQAVPFKLRLLLWTAFTQHLQGRRPSPHFLKTIEASLSLACRQRLARLGALLPAMFAAEHHLTATLVPMVAAMEAPPRQTCAHQQHSQDLLKLIQNFITEKDLPTPTKRHKLIELRIYKLLNQS